MNAPGGRVPGALGVLAAVGLVLSVRWGVSSALH